MAEFMEAASSLTFGVWFLVGTAMVFFMQCGFAMVEAGFTRAKNAGNIIMKNLMDFCIGSVVFVTLGSGLMLAEDYIAGFEFSADPTLADIVPAPATPAVPVEAAVPVEVKSSSAPENTGKKITKVEIICKESRFEALKAAMDAVGITGMTVTKVLGCGIQKGKTGYYRGVKIESMDLNPKVQVDIVVSAVPVRTLIEAAKKALYTGNIGDGKIFVYDVENVVKVRTGEEGYDALQGDEQF